MFVAPLILSALFGIGFVAYIVGTFLWYGLLKDLFRKKPVLQHGEKAKRKRFYHPARGRMMSYWRKKSGGA